MATKKETPTELIDRLRKGLSLPAGTPTTDVINSALARAKTFRLAASNAATRPTPTTIVRPAATRQGKIFARNPLLNERQANLGYMPKAPAPTLFASGDTPPYTASGNPPSELLKLPWQVRHAAAKADQAEWARLFMEYDRDDVDTSDLIFEPAVHDPGNDEYLTRFAAWSSGR